MKNCILKNTHTKGITDKYVYGLFKVKFASMLNVNHIAYTNKLINTIRSALL